MKPILVPRTFNDDDNDDVRRGLEELRSPADQLVSIFSRTGEGHRRDSIKWVPERLSNGNGGPLPSKQYSIEAVVNGD